MTNKRSTDIPPVLGPEVYSPWRASKLGQITDELEESLLLELIGNPEGLTILDVGCGEGRLANLLAERGAQVIGVDPSESMIAAARHNATARGTAATFQCGKAENLPFDAAQFDLVVANTILCFVDDASQVFSEIARVLRPDGRLVIGELGRWSFWALQRYIRGRFGSSLWRRGNSWTASQLRTLAGNAGLTATTIRGSVFYPRWGLAAQLLTRLDRPLGKFTNFGAAYIAMLARKPGARR